jgi:hypothetical protein
MTSIWLERVALIGVVTTLGGEALRLERRNGRDHAALENATRRQFADSVLTKGDRLPVLRGVDPSGRFVTAAFKSSGSVIITLGTSCPTTRTNIPKWRRLAARLGEQGVQLIWLSRDHYAETGAFLKAEGLPGLVLSDLPYDTYVRFGLAVVPQAIVERSGTVVAAWKGILNEEEVVRALDALK